MTLSSSYLIVQEKTCFYLEEIGVEIDQYLGHSTDVYYFKVKIINFKQESLRYDSISKSNPNLFGLLRIGKINGCLSRELEIRQHLTNHKMIAPLVKVLPIEKVLINQNYQKQNFDHFYSQILTNNDDSNNNDEYLAEEYYEEISYNETIENGLITLSLINQKNQTLESFLQEEQTLEKSLTIIIQICQIFNYIQRQGWGITQIYPKFIYVNSTLEFHDLLGVLKIGEKFEYGITGNHAPPELAFCYPTDQQMSSYIIGSLFYQLINHQLPTINENLNLKIKPIPGIYQIIKSCLSPAQNRPPIAKLLNSLVQLKQLVKQPEINWQIAGKTIIGLSENRWHNEDNYGYRQHFLSSLSESLILGVLADGMGGMEHGEIASLIAVKTILEAPIPANINTIEQGYDWLISLIEKANRQIFETVKNGGTTLSVILAIGDKLTITHIGDSRIYLLRNGQICQISEDHSLVANLLATNQITYLESQNHPERNVLTRSLGSTRQLKIDEIQNLTIFDDNLTMNLENQDILILCSDGVWDLISSDELCEIFTQSTSLSSAVEETINLVLTRGANDNATILACNCFIQKSY